MAALSDDDPNAKQKHDMLAFWRPTDSWVRVHLRRFGEHGILWDVQRRGDPLKGTVLLTAREADDKWCVFTQICTTEDEVFWMRAHGDRFVSCRQATVYLDESITKDPDVWIIHTAMTVISSIDRQQLQSWY